MRAIIKSAIILLILSMVSRFKLNKKQLAILLIVVFLFAVTLPLFCAVFHITVPMPWVRQVMGCELSLDEHAAIMFSFVGFSDGRGNPMAAFTSILAMCLFAVFIGFKSQILPVRIKQIIRLYPERRDRLLDLFRFGILNPKIFPTN